MARTSSQAIRSSFRDPSGFVFRRDGTLYRQINKSYGVPYQLLKQSGLYDELVSEKLLIPHTETNLKGETSEALLIIQPEEVPFISYPYEWSFSELKDAALTTLTIHKKALARGMSLKDASAYNIQFYQGRPLLVDTLSFEAYEEGHPWVAYRQFCQHFLAPLALMSYTHLNMNKLFRVYLDGVPLDLAVALLPTRCRFRPNLLAHIYVHAHTQTKMADRGVARQNYKISRFATEALIDSLYSAIKSLRLPKTKTEWGDYYENTNYSTAAFRAKEKQVEDAVKLVKPQQVWDLGGNDGRFSRIAARMSIPTISFDIDPLAVEYNYLNLTDEERRFQLPLILDLTNPSPDLGWAHEERDSLLKRGPADLVFALALIHHLAISNNLPFSFIASYLAQLGKNLLIEFVPKEDSQVKRLLRTREDIFGNYTQQKFEEHFSQFFTIKKSWPIKGSRRTLYLMKRK